MSSWANRAVQSVARRFGYAVVLEHLNTGPAGDLAGSKIDYRYLDDVMRLLSGLTTVAPRNLVEVGANYAQDAAYLVAAWNLPPESAYLFEPHPDIAARVREAYPFRTVQAAVGDFDGEVDFHAVHLDSGNSGISSARVHSENADDSYDVVKVPMTRLDTFMDRHRLTTIDFLKVDVEGLTFEVLRGLGARIDDVQAIQIETEYLQVWRDQHTETEVYRLLQDAGFQLVQHQLGMDGVQADSLWVHARHVRHRVYDVSHGQWRDRDVT